MNLAPLPSRSAAGVRPKIATERPCESMRSTRRRPRNPVPPVTKILVGEEEFTGRFPVKPASLEAKIPPMTVETNSEPWADPPPFDPAWRSTSELLIEGLDADHLDLDWADILQAKVLTVDVLDLLRQVSLDGIEFGVGPDLQP